MDPITHGLIGAGVAALSGQPFAWNNPIYLGSVLGSMAPDLDIVMQARGHIAYLKHHRGISHSLPALLGFSLVISFSLRLLFPTASFTQLFLWTFTGTLSHGLFDLLNAYGAKLLWPFVKRRLTLNSIIVSDPVILGSFLLALSHNPQHPNVAILAFAISGLYVAVRWRGKRDVTKIVQEVMGDWCQILVFPALYRPFSWNFVVDKGGIIVTGTVPFGGKRLIITERLPKAGHPSIDAVEESPLGEVFREFTPHYCVSHQWQGDCQVVRFMDLRYRAQQGFMHTGTAILDKEGELIEEVFEPYNAKKRIRIA